MVARALLDGCSVVARAVLGSSLSVLACWLVFVSVLGGCSLVDRVAKQLLGGC